MRTINTATIVAVCILTLAGFVLGVLAASPGCATAGTGDRGAPATTTAGTGDRGPGTATTAPAHADKFQISDPKSQMESVGPTILEILALAGVPGAGLIGAIWSRRRLERRTANLVHSVQAGRDRLVAHAPEARVIFDDVVRALQDDATAALVNRIRRKSEIRNPKSQIK